MAARLRPINYTIAIVVYIPPLVVTAKTFTLSNSIYSNLHNADLLTNRISYTVFILDCISLNRCLINRQLSILPVLLSYNTGCMYMVRLSYKFTLHNHINMYID